MKRLMFLALMGLMTVGASAQRVTDKLSRGLVAIPQGDKTGQDSRYGTTGSGIFLTWRKLPTEYFDTKYNVYRNGQLRTAEPISVTNYTDGGGNKSCTYKVVPVVKGVELTDLASETVKPWDHQYWDIPVQPVVNRNGATLSGYSLNDCSVADVDGDGQMEFVVKRRNDSGNLNTSGNKTDFNLHECYKMDGTRLWWIDMGPNLMAGPDEQFDLILCDWDRDGKAEAVMRGADNMIIHTSTGKAIKIGNMNYYAPRDEYTHQGAEYLLYLNGETGEPYGWDGTGDTFTPMAYPLPRFESGETDYAAVWGKADTGHRSCKHYLGAPYLDGRNPSIFLGRGCYTRHKFCALDVDPATHKITQRWRWNCYDGASPWFGQGFHNYAIADVDMDGRDEIVFGSMMIDDTGYGLATTGYGHGDAQHCTDLDPYRWGLEQFVCLESTAVPGVAYTDATSQTLYYTSGTGGDNGRAMAGNFQNTYPGGVARSPGCGLLSCASDLIIEGDGHMASDDYWNMRIYWDGDLLDEFMDSPGVERAPTVYKYGGQAEVGTGRAAYANDRCWMGEGALNNSSKNNPCFLGDILGDWREEIVVRAGDALRIYTTSFPSPWGMTSLWYDHVYRNGMAWQCVGYNQPPQTSFFVGELEGITKEPPALTIEGRTEIENGGTVSGTGSEQLLISGYDNKTVSVSDGAAPAVLTVNAPAWVKGSGGTKQSDGSVRCFAGTAKQPARSVETFTTTLTGGAFGGDMHLVKQGEGVLQLPSVTEKHTGSTDVWNGTLQFDGTMEKSPVWLNRHTTLLSNGGRFLGGLKADYNATIYPGGKDQVGSISTTRLELGFGSRLVIDIDGDNIDQISADELFIETKTGDAWTKYGPKYIRPVIQFNVKGELKAGKHLIGTLAAIDTKTEGAGTLNDFVIEGLNTDKVTYLSHEDGKLYFIVNDIRPAASVVWNGTAASSVWDYGVTKNFLNAGTADVSIKGDNVVFTDDAENTSINIVGGVQPQSVTFANDTKTYTLTGDSIVGGGTITKSGAADVVINTLNRTGATYLQKGKLEVSMLANKSGQQYGALGDASKAINMSEGTTLKMNGTIITDQTINVENAVSLEVPAGKSVILNTGLKGTGATVTKTGSGYLQLGVSNTIGKLVINGGEVESQKSGGLMQVPATIELNAGTFTDFPNENSGFTNKANFIVPKGKTAYINGAPYCAYTGTLTGAGTLTFYSGGANTNLQGDWSAFEGTLKVGMKDRTVKGTTVSFKMLNSKGMPNATLNINDRFGSDYVTVTTQSVVPFGSIVGNGTLAGTGFIIGCDNKDQNVNFKATAPITKRGTGDMEVFEIGALTKSVTIEEGTLYISDDTREKRFFGGTLTLTGAGKMKGSGLVPAFSMGNGTEATLQDDRWLEGPGTLQVTNNANIMKGATLNFLIYRNREGGYSQLLAGMLTLNGTVNVVLQRNPAAGDAFTLWSGTTTIAGTPTIVLPELPEGLAWDTTELVDADGKALKKGVLKVVASVGINQTTADTVVSCEVYTVGGVLVGQTQAARSDLSAAVAKLGVKPGLYIVKMQADGQTGTETVVVK